MRGKKIMKKYYIVIAKCGHVGKGKYVEVEFPVMAESKSEASKRILKAPKVKKQLKNAITCVFEVLEEEYYIAKIRYDNNEYVHSHYKREYNYDCLQIKELELGKKFSSSFNSRAERIKYYFSKLNFKREVYDYDFNA